MNLSPELLKLLQDHKNDLANNNIDWLFDWDQIRKFSDKIKKSEVENLIVALEADEEILNKYADNSDYFICTINKPEISLMSEDEFNTLSVSGKFRTIDICWLKDKSGKVNLQTGINNILVFNGSGKILNSGIAPNNTQLGVCPVIKFKDNTLNYILGSDIKNKANRFKNFEFLGREWELYNNNTEYILYNNHEVIGNMAFDNFSANYDNSEIKKFLEDWLQEKLNKFGKNLFLK